MSWFFYCFSQFASHHILGRAWLLFLSLDSYKIYIYLYILSIRRQQKGRREQKKGRGRGWMESVYRVSACIWWHVSLNWFWSPAAGWPLARGVLGGDIGSLPGPSPAPPKLSSASLLVIVVAAVCIIPFTLYLALCRSIVVCDEPVAFEYLSDGFRLANVWPTEYRLRWLLAGCCCCCCDCDEDMEGGW